MAERPKARDRQAPELRSRPRPGGVGSTAGEPPDTSHPRRHQLFRLPCLAGLWFNMLHISSQANTWQGRVVAGLLYLHRSSSTLVRALPAVVSTRLGNTSRRLRRGLGYMEHAPLLCVSTYRPARRAPCLARVLNNCLVGVGFSFCLPPRLYKCYMSGRYCFHLSCTYLSFNSL